MAAEELDFPLDDVVEGDSASLNGFWMQTHQVTNAQPKAADNPPPCMSFCRLPSAASSPHRANRQRRRRGRRREAAQTF